MTGGALAQRGDTGAWEGEGEGGLGGGPGKGGLRALRSPMVVSVTDHDPGAASGSFPRGGLPDGSRGRVEFVLQYTFFSV